MQQWHCIAFLVRRKIKFIYQMGASLTFLRAREEGFGFVSGNMYQVKKEKLLSPERSDFF